MKHWMRSFFVFLLLLCTGCTMNLDMQAPNNTQETNANIEITMPDLVEPGQEKNETDNTEEAQETSEQGTATVVEGESYTRAEDVADYLRVYGALPPNYMTKNEARDQGWIAEQGNLRDIADDAMIGGDRFGNREGNLPTADGRKYYEADVNYDGGHRGAERLVYSNDGLIFYTQDHYDTFEDWTEETP